MAAPAGVGSFNFSMDLCLDLNQSLLMSMFLEFIKHMLLQRKFTFLGLLACLIGSNLRAQNADAPWSGDWQTYWRGGGAILHFTQSELEVSGTYPLYEGKVEALVRGRQLEGRWFEQSGREGQFLFVMSPDQQTFMGRFDSGEWWTGNRLMDAEAFDEINVNLSSPRETLRSMIMAGQAAEEGFIELIQPALQTVDWSQIRSLKIPESPPLPQERIDYIRLLMKVLDFYTFRLWDLPGPSLPGSTMKDAVQIQLHQKTAMHDFEISFSRKNQLWLIDPVAPQALKEHLHILEKSKTKPSTSPNEVALPDSPVMDGSVRPRINPNLSSPRETMHLFLDAIEHFRLGGRLQVFRTMDLDALNVLIHEEEAELIAYYLKQVLDRIGHTILQEIPNDPFQKEPYVHFRHARGDIVIAPILGEDGMISWKFSGPTIAQLRPLYMAIEDMPLEANPPYKSVSPPAYFLFREKIRGYSPLLLTPLGILEIWQWMGLIVISLASMSFSIFFTHLVLMSFRHNKKWGFSLSTRRARLLMLWPMRATLVGFIWHYFVGILGLPESLSSPVHNLSMSVVITSMAWLLYRGAGLAHHYSRKSTGTKGQHAVITSLALGLLRLIILLVAMLLLAHIWGIPYAGVLTGLGIGGLAFALAAQPTLQNIIAGFTLYADNPLSVGDFCRYDDNVGTVEEIGLRSTRIRSLERSLISIPNTEFANMQLDNLGSRDRFLLKETIQVRYETSPDQLRYILAEVRKLLIQHPKINPDPARVRLHAFGAFSLDLQVFAYIETSHFNDYLAIKEDVLFRIMERVERSGSSFAFPSQVTYFAKDSGMDKDRSAKAEKMVEKWREETKFPFPDFTDEEIHRMKDTLDYPVNQEDPRHT